MMSILLIIAVIVPIILGIILLTARYFDKIAGWLTAGIITAVTIILIIAAIPVWSGTPVEIVFDWAGEWLQFGLLMDSLSTYIVLLIAVVGAGAAFYSIKYMHEAENQRVYYSLYSFFFAGMIGVVLATNLLQFFFFWEAMLIPSYLMIIYWGTKGKAAKAALKYFLYTQIGSIGILIAFAILGFYGSSGTYTLDIATIAAGIGSSGIPGSLLYLTFVLMMIGFAVKMAVFPFQNWLPDAHGEAPTPISVLLSAVMIETASYAIVRMGFEFYANIFSSNISRFVLEAIGAVTLFYGGFLALRQTDVKRLLAYSSVSQMGYIFIGLATYSTMGTAGGLFHILAHGFGKGILFMVAGMLMHNANTRDITKMGGLGRKWPVVAVISFIGALNLAGTPPLAGFFSEWMIFNGALEVAQTAELVVVAIILLLGSILSAAYMLRFLWKVFLGPTPTELEEAKKPHALLWVPAGVLALLAIFFGIFADYAVQLFGVVL